MGRNGTPPEASQLKPLDQVQAELVEKAYKPACAIAYKMAQRCGCASWMKGEIGGITALALIETVHRWNPRRNDNFEIFASRRVRGAVIDYIRRNSLKSRSCVDFEKEYDQAVWDLKQELGCEPELEQIAQRMGTDLENLQLRMRTALQRVVEPLNGQGLKLAGESPSGYDAAAQAETLSQIMVALQSLAQREQYVITKYYFEEICMRDIAAALRVSESSVCQIHAQAISKLRSKLSSKQAPADGAELVALTALRHQLMQEASTLLNAPHDLRSKLGLALVNIQLATVQSQIQALETRS